MFERNKVDTSDRMVGISVEITLDDGRTLKGKLAIPTSKSLAEVLNGGSGFMAFEHYDGETEFLAKHAFRSVKHVDVPKARTLPVSQTDDFDPHAVLGVDRTASDEEIRTAFRQKSMRYHPDRYANVALPDEVRTYLDVISRRINAAHAALQQEQTVQKRYREQRTTPVYESPSRR